ncbi:MAG: peptidoglycan DD-metalloendopeptidase family protein, partial [Oceanospirillaceae bacterium]|nr:peptidoglycan DD-metalloendopeptidase family protein [Oceanospirillaceae bacterium]
GYMSLYGHNQSLLRQTGDWVAAGDGIAVSGSSGGYAQPALYFSIRQKAKSVDPIKWLQRP